MTPDQYFQALAPKQWADTATRAQVQALYPIATEYVPAAQWGTYQAQAIALYSLHLQFLGASGSDAGIITPLVQAKSGPDQEKKWAPPIKGDDDLDLSRWGIMFKRLRDTAYGAFMFPQTLALPDVVLGTPYFRGPRC